MTRINTNVSSLVAQNNLAKSNTELQTALTRLSTGLRINSGKDDPSGMIAAARLGSDIASTNQAISNTKAAESMIDTADSALSQVTTLLNEVRALIVQTANDSTMSSEQIAANQSQIDSSLAAIDRIAQTTNYQGRNLLNGNMDFIYANTGAVTDLQNSDTTQIQINQANLSSGDDIIATTHVTTEAVQGTVTNTGAITSGQAYASVTLNTSTGTDLKIDATAYGGAWNNYTVTLTSDTTTLKDGQVVAQYDADGKTLNIKYNATGGDIAFATVQDAIEEVTTDFEATAGQIDEDTVATLSDDTDGGTDGGINGAVSFELIGNVGSQVINLRANMEGDDIMDAINLLTDYTGVEADWNGTRLLLSSVDYGSDQFVQVNMISDATTGGTTFTSGFSALYNDGEDIIGTINGYTAVGQGNTLSVNTPALAMSVTMTAPSTTSKAGKDLILTISAGGALFQLGADINSNNQASLGIQSTSTGNLGGPDGRLFQLLTGGAADLASGYLNTATKIVDEALDMVTSLRGRLGAFESATLETNSATLADTVTALTSAQSTIQDADFAAETANLTRAQILVQSGTAVLKIANQNPQNVLSLLQ
jgi:flagellin